MNRAANLLIYVIIYFTLVIFISREWSKYVKNQKELTPEEPGPYGESIERFVK